MKNRPFGSHGYIWVTALFFVGTLILHFIFAWYAYVDEQESLGLTVQMSEYLIQTLRDMFENWQSEFLQLIWQVLGLAYLLYVGSPQSKEGDERLEEKVDAILRSVDQKKGKETIKKLDEEYART